MLSVYIELESQKRRMEDAKTNKRPAIATPSLVHTIFFRRLALQIVISALASALISAFAHQQLK
jgi:hypothetical protein